MEYLSNQFPYPERCNSIQQGESLGDNWATFCLGYGAGVQPWDFKWIEHITTYWPPPQCKKASFRDHASPFSIRAEHFIPEMSCRVGFGMCEVLDSECEVLDSEGIFFQLVLLQFRKRLWLASLYGPLCKLIDGQRLGVAWSDICTHLACRKVLIFLVFESTTGMEVTFPRN